MAYETSELALDHAGDIVKTECMPTSPSRVSTASGSEESQDSQDAKTFVEGSRFPSQENRISLESLVVPPPNAASGDLHNAIANHVRHSEKVSQDMRDVDEADGTDTDNSSDNSSDTSTDSDDLEDYDLSVDEGVPSAMMSSASSSPKHKAFSHMREKKKTVIFQPGRIGVDYHEGTVTFVQAGGQADEVGVAIGWKMLRLNGMRCTFFGDDLMIAAAQGNVPYEVTFAVEIQGETNEGDIAHSLAPSKETFVVPSCNNDVMAVEELMESCKTPTEINIMTPIGKTSEHVLMPNLKSQVGKPRENTQTMCACDHENLNNGNLTHQVADCKKDHECVATILDKNRLKMKPTIRRKEFLSAAVVAATKDEEEGKELLAALGANISSREQELERKLAMAESMVREIQEREIEQELGITVDEDEHAGQSFTNCDTSSFMTGSWFGSNSFWESASQDQRQSIWRRWFSTSSTTAAI